MKIAGLWSGHDCSFCVMEDGRPLAHTEYERYLREKEPKGDSLGIMMSADYMLDGVIDSIDEIDEFVSCHPSRLLTDYASFEYLKSKGKKVRFLGHHQAHAAHAFYSSNFENAIVFTIDGGGVEDLSGNETATTVWLGEGKKLNHVKTVPSSKMNIGGLWTRATRYVFRLQNGWPRGHQAGTVMAMAALGDSSRFRDDFSRMLREDILPASAKPAGQPLGPYTGNDPRHPYLGKWTDTADASEQNTFDLAAGLQAATEDLIREFMAPFVTQAGPDVKICIAGGVALNSVIIGKVKGWFPNVSDVFVPPVPYDAGLSLGAAQYVHHHIHGVERVTWSDNFTPYLGASYKGIQQSLIGERKDITFKKADVNDLVSLLLDGKIVAVFNGGSESGRRALGNRSILADPRRPDMKETINEKVKHRQWFRPFAPSIMREHVTSWFTEDVSSPYMTHVVKFKEEVRHRVPAVVHFDGSARLQTVTQKDNPWYYDFLTRWHVASGVPIILNTSFNDREPIVQTPEHAVDCYLSTNIDFLFFVDDGILVTRTEKSEGAESE